MYLLKEKRRRAREEEKEKWKEEGGISLLNLPVKWAFKSKKINGDFSYVPTVDITRMCRLSGTGSPCPSRHWVALVLADVPWRWHWISSLTVELGTYFRSPFSQHPDPPHCLLCVQVLCQGCQSRSALPECPFLKVHRPPGGRSQLQDIMVMWPWASHLNSPNLSFVSVKWG